MLQLTARTDYKFRFCSLLNPRKTPADSAICLGKSGPQLNKSNVLAKRLRSRLTLVPLLILVVVLTFVVVVSLVVIVFDNEGGNDKENDNGDEY